jgi:hypothetical protein
MSRKTPRHPHLPSPRQLVSRTKAAGPKGGRCQHGPVCPAVTFRTLGVAPPITPNATLPAALLEGGQKSGTI